MVRAQRGRAGISAAASVSVVSQVLTRAGLERSLGVRPASVAAWVGRRIFDETGRIDLVAARCGARSLDAAARLIGWDWQPADG
jgi:integrase/recombinase XerC